MNGKIKSALLALACILPIMFALPKASAQNNVNSTAPAQACTWNYKMVNGRATASYCGDVTANFIPPGARTRLTGALVLWVVKTNVNAGSSDSNDCLTFQTACLTINGAIAKLKNYDTEGNTVNIQPYGNPQTYTENVLAFGPMVGGGTIVINGQGTVTIDGANANPSISSINAASVLLQNIGVVNSGSGAAVNASTAGIIDVASGVALGSTGGSQLDSNQGGVIVVGTVTIAGTSTSFLHANSQGVIVLDGATVTCLGNPVYTAYDAGASFSYIEAIGATFTACSGVTGPRFSLNRNATIRTNTNNISFFPGNSQGSVSSGAVFDDYGSWSLFTTVAGLSAYPCNVTSAGVMATVTDAVTPTYKGALTGGGTPASETRVICSWNGTTGTWLSN